MEIGKRVKECVVRALDVVKEEGLCEWFRDLKEMTVFLYGAEIKYQFKNIFLQKLISLVNALKTFNEFHILKTELQFTFINVLLCNIKLGIGLSDFKLIYYQIEIDKKPTISEGFSTLFLHLLHQHNKTQILNKKTLEGKLVEILKHFNIKNFEFFIRYLNWKIKSQEKSENIDVIIEEFMNLIKIIFENGKSFKFYRKVSIYLIEYYNEPNHYVGLIKKRLELRLNNARYDINIQGVDRDESRLDDVILFGARPDNDIKLDEIWGDFTFLIYYTHQYYLVPDRSSKQVWIKIEPGTAVEVYDGFRFILNELELKVEITKSVQFVLRKDGIKMSLNYEIDWKCELGQFITLEPFSNPMIGLQRKLIFFYSREQTRIRYFIYNLDASLLMKCESLKLIPESSVIGYPCVNRRLNQIRQCEASKIPLLPHNIYQFFNFETYPPKPNVQSITLIIAKPFAYPLELTFTPIK